MVSFLKLYVVGSAIFSSKPDLETGISQLRLTRDDTQGQNGLLPTKEKKIFSA